MHSSLQLLEFTELDDLVDLEALPILHPSLYSAVLSCCHHAVCCRLMQLEHGDATSECYNIRDCDLDGRCGFQFFSVLYYYPLVREVMNNRITCKTST